MTDTDTISLCFLLDNMRSPFNVGSLFRIADALGVEKLWLTGQTIRPPNDKIRKNSRATDKSVAYEYRADALSLIAELKSSGYKIVSLELTSESIPLHQLQLDQPKICLILGSENEGVAPELLAASDAIVMIPMQGQNESMNVATAAAIAAYSILSPHTQKTIY
jgi:tRNA G18 (ribose-2'-O)-methylase SpoU